MKNLSQCKIGFIGAGVMGSALIASCAKVISTKNIIIADVSERRAELVAESYGCMFTASNIDLVKKSDIIFLAVKPSQIQCVATEITQELSNKILVSIAAGITLSALQQYTVLPPAGFVAVNAIIRLMPNLPTTVGEGMIALSALETIQSKTRRESIDLVKELLKEAGRVEEVEEYLMDCVTAVSGSGPAYAFMFIEALADAAVLMGMPRKQAYVYASQTLKGAARLVLESGRHPADLKDAVCSPSGTTIEAVTSLEEHGFRTAIINAALAAYKKSQLLGVK
jgi:pyrroline-5-carboxylate reductase